MIFKSSQINVFHDIDILLNDDSVEIGWKDEAENIQEHQRNMFQCILLLLDAFQPLSL
jgi:hypothetical protein